MSRGMCIPFTVSCNHVIADMGRVSYTYRRGVCVARFDKMGDARASIRETSNRYRFSRFSFYIRYSQQPNLENL